MFFPTCQVRVVRFYVSCRLLPSASCLVLLLLVLLVLLVVLVVLVQLRSAIHRVLCRTSTRTIPAQCSLPDLNREYPRQVFPAGPQPRVSTRSVPCRTSCRKICQIECQIECHIECHKICQIECQKICQIECQKICQIECQKICQIECQKICQIECQNICQKICQIDMPNRYAR